MTQFTRAWTAAGALRFDALAEVKALAPKALDELNWETLYQRADLNVRAAIVKLRHCDVNLAKLTPGLDDLTRVAMCDAAYNGGWAHLQQDRKLCGLTQGCNPNKWFGHVENHSVKSRVKWQGYGQSAYDVNRGHVRNTVPLQSRRAKYVEMLGV